MSAVLYFIIFLLLCSIFVLSLKIFLMRKAAREIKESLDEKLQTDTNTLIDISSRDKHMQNLAAAINGQLRLLIEERRRFVQGDKAIKDAVTNISHDLRTPLTAIYGYLDLLKDEEKSENAEHYLSIIKNRTDALKRLTGELFSYSALITSPDTQQKEELVLNRLLEESVLAYYGALKKCGISPEISMPEVPICRTLNKNALSRIFSNIISNAVKYSSGDLKITLTPNGEIIFSNNAPGLNELTASQLFNRFYTVETARKTEGGIGLSIARSLTEEMGGSITARYVAGRLYIHLKF